MTNPRSDHAKGGEDARVRRRRYATREEQLRELRGHLRERDERVREALVTGLTSAPPRVLAAIGTLVNFVGVARATAAVTGRARRRARAAPRS